MEVDAFPADHAFLVSLRQHLTSRHGRSRSAKEADQISQEVSRYLHFADPSRLRQELLLDATALDRYLQTMEQQAVQASTQNAKLCHIRQGINYLQLNLDPGEVQQVGRVLELIGNWSSAIGKEARKANTARLEEKSEQPTAFGAVEQFLSCKALHTLFTTLVHEVKRGNPVALKDIRVVTIWLAGSLLLTNHQRPGAVSKAQLAEYMRGSTTTHGRITYKTFKVQEHKTGTTGSAKMTTGKVLTALIDGYVQHLRPLLPSVPQPGGEPPGLPVQARAAARPSARPHLADRHSGPPCSCHSSYAEWP